MGLSDGAKRCRVYAFRWVSRERGGLYQVVKCRAGGMGVGGREPERIEGDGSVGMEGRRRAKYKERISKFTDWPFLSDLFFVLSVLAKLILLVMLLLTYIGNDLLNFCV